MITMIDGIGIDIVELEDIKKRMNEAFLKRILSNEEYQRYLSINDLGRQIAFVAGRFAAKEAYTKAYGVFETPLMFSEVSITQSENQKPVLKSQYRSLDICDVSISHSEHYAVAIVVLQKKDQ